MAKLVIDTQKSLFKPITIEIDGKVFTARRMDRQTMKKLGEYDEAVISGDSEAPFKRLEFLIGKDSVINKLELREINAITNHITAALYKPEKVEPEEEKKAKSPGVNKSPK